MHSNKGLAQKVGKVAGEARIVASLVGDRHCPAWVQAEIPEMVPELGASQRISCHRTL